MELRGESFRITSRKGQVTRIHRKDTKNQTEQFAITQTAMLNSLGQGFWMFNSSGNCLAPTSKACQELIECDPTGKRLVDVLKVNEHEQESTSFWIESLFAGDYDFYMVADLGPKNYRHSKGKEIRLNYYPIYRDNNKLDKVVVVATDVTNEVAAKKKAKEQEGKALLILDVLKNPKQLMSYLKSFKRLYKTLNEHFSLASPCDVLEIYRILHSIKGNSLCFNMVQVAENVHELEEYFCSFNEVELRKDWENIRSQSLIILTDIWKSFEESTQIYEDLLASSYHSQDHQVCINLKYIEDFKTELNQAAVDEKIITKYDYLFMTTPILEQFTHYEQYLKELAKKYEKTIPEITYKNMNIRIPRNRYNNLFTSLSQYYRNIVDHALETEQERKNNEKQGANKITIEFEKDQEFIQIKITDDGKGIDPDKLRKKVALSQQLAHYQEYDDKEILEVIFEPSFSTRESVSLSAGRGIGMNAIKEEVQREGGHISIESQVHKGTSLTITLPL